MTHYAFIGAGSWAAALACVADRQGFQVSLFSRSIGRSQALAKHRHLPSMPKDWRLPAKINVTNNIDDCLHKASAAFLVLPVQETYTFLQSFSTHLVRAKIPVVACSKGIDRHRFLTPAAMLRNLIPSHYVAVLSGPNFANEVAQGLPTATVIAAEDSALSERLCKELSGSRFRCYQSQDIIGVSLCGALKNILAIAAGIVAGMGYGENARAALISRGLNELATYLDYANGDRTTLYGLAGLGDIVLTCSSPSSRNYAFGHRYGHLTREGKNPIDARGSKLVEGEATCHALAELAKENSISLPITMGLSRILRSEISISDQLDMLLNRPLKHE